MPSLRTLAIAAAALLSAAPAFAQNRDTVTVTAKGPTGRPTLMSYLGKHPIPETVDGLIERLNEPNVCSKEAAPVANPNRPCAIVAYLLVSSEETRSTPQLVFRAIQFVTHPDKPSETTLWMTDLYGRIAYFSNTNIDEPLRPMRVPHSCRREWNIYTEMQTVKCTRVNALYLPFGILGYGENEEQKILTGKVKDAFFTLAMSTADLSPEPGGNSASSTRK